MDYPSNIISAAGVTFYNYNTNSTEQYEGRQIKYTYNNKTLNLENPGMIINDIALADADELFANPCHPYTKSLLSAIPFPDPHYEKQRKRIIYTPELDHDYTEEGPSLREVTPNHFVYCNTAEAEKYQAEINAK